MPKFNPYRPGAGLMPPYIAGREEYISEASDMFDALKLNIPKRSIIYSGLRGVGKTVLLNKTAHIAEEKGVFCYYLEIEENSDFSSQIIECTKKYLQKASLIQRLKNILEIAKTAIQSFEISFCPNDNSISLSPSEKFWFTSSNMTQSLTDVFVSVGKVAYEMHTPLCFFYRRNTVYESR